MPEILRRPRRIAADEAHAWARNLRLGNPNAKLVLSMLTLYVNGEATCFVGVDSLAEDTELASNTVRRRLAWLEQIGAISRIPQWVDDNGRRNSDGRGRRTTDLIKLLVDADPEAIECAAKNAIDESSPTPQAGLNDTSSAISPPSQVGLNPPGPPVSPALALPVVEGPNTLNHEPEEESPPTPPSGGEDEFSKRGIGGERLRQIGAVWPEAITDAHRAVNVLSALNEIEFQQCLTGARGYASYIRNRREAGRARVVKDFHNWARNRQWIGFLGVGGKVEVAAQAQNVAIDSPEGKALRVLHAIAHLSEPYDFSGKYRLPQPMSASALALANAPPRRDWIFIAEDQTNQIGAWRGLINRELAYKARPELITDRGTPGLRRGLMAPWPWPPKVDGSIYEPPPPADPLADENSAELKQGMG